ncbi:short-chain dehydrogenase [Mycobacterium heckeshornense]|uniref:Short-chain dehydrogenase n=1 Tax=Mycobacterium heckeshornense TaxID=110505 RepID=A0A2G8B4P9_9MYCO|nr:SDR family NAD(P)-dependent oxidoreductase [Mycobacterium heckeshornense]KMV24220.1 short-chain dehydrogenase [Mycobacterium heckeshornense]MCV7036452.1 SDR family NAD(P)-dependent oxidoreductase [Mycobacterium heckeshornense]PIJ32723.1 short-chain dehydrogenase [Mycobacterium heckeshornense]BCO34313.1 short-chain dehydrogenase [Mycobacterium heckeshornense]BCQ07450.1 short-chain dehydrogenase [Mycobacterium heckeshornense]
MTGLLDGKVALVTGAGHGIGRGHALELARHGAVVIVNDLGTSLSGEGSGRVADKVVQIIESRAGKAISDFSDVGDEQQVELMVERAYSQLGRLDIVVNNAGIVRDKAIWNMTADDFDLVMRVHVRGSWLTSRAVARRWRSEAKANGGKVYGRIINTTSGAGLHGNFGQTNYSAAKAAIVGLTQTLSLELASIGATANVISPGGRTRMSASMPGAAAPIEPDELSEDEFDPKDPALSSPVVAWLASPEAGHISGQIIRAVGENLQLLKGWHPVASVSNGGKRWNAGKLGAIMGTDVFGTRNPGLRLGG